MIFLGTVALEPNRWGSRKSSLSVPDFSGRAREAGFEGLELWEDHFLQATVEEAERMNRDLPVAVFNSYAPFTRETQEKRDRATESIRRLGAWGAKWNVGNEPEKRGEYLDMAEAWVRQLPPEFRFLCECHPGTLLEEAGAARSFLDELSARVADRGVHVGAIWHPFNLPEASLGPVWEQLGGYLDHAHVQPRLENVVVSLAEPAIRARDRIKKIRDLGYLGTWTIEFVPGTRQPGENPEALFTAACREREILSGLLQG